MNCSPEQKMKLKKMILEELLADVDAAEGKKLIPKPVEGLGDKMNELAEGEEKMEAPEVGVAETVADKPDDEEMSDEDLKKLLAASMG